MRPPSTGYIPKIMRRMNSLSKPCFARMEVEGRKDHQLIEYGLREPIRQKLNGNAVAGEPQSEPIEIPYRVKVECQYCCSLGVADNKGKILEYWN